MSLERTSVLPTRLACLDNLRYLMVLGVLAFHSTSAYVGATYFVVDPNPSDVTRWLNQFFISFVMIVLFFLSGYFALPSLEAKGCGRFIFTKLKRLGMPLLLGVTFIAPISTYIAHAAQGFQGLADPGYWSFWTTYMSSVPDFPAARIGSRAFSANTQFHYHHFWFIASLLAMSILFAALWKLKQRVVGNRFALIRSEAASNAEVSLTVLVFAGLLVLTIPIQGTLYRIPGIRVVGNLLGTSPGGFIGYGVYFALGIVAYRKRWFVNGTYPGPVIGWLVAWLAILLEDELGLRLSLEPLEDMVYIGLFCGLAYRFLNRATPIQRSLAANSYPMFIIHFPIVALVQYLLLPVGIPTPAKFLVCAVTAVGVSWLISNYLILPAPRRAMVGLVGLFLAMSLVLHPEQSAARGEIADQDRWRDGRRGGPEHLIEMRLRQYDRELDLTDAQEAALRPLVEAQVRQQMEAEQALQDSLEGLLSEEQMRRFRRMRWRRWRD